MKKKIISALLMMALLLTFVPSREAKADVLAVTEVAAAAYAAMNSWGYEFTATNATMGGMQNFMEGAITDYINERGGSLASLFGGEMARAVAGQMVAGQAMYNGLVDFANWAANAYDLSSVNSWMTGEYNGTAFNRGSMQGKIGTSGLTGVGYEAVFSNSRDYGQYGTWYGLFEIYNNGQRQAYISANVTANRYFKDEWYTSYSGTALVANIPLYNVYSGEVVSVYTLNIATVSENQMTNNLKAKQGASYVAPSAISTGQQWTGTINGSTANSIDDIVEDIFGDVAQNSLSVAGNVGTAVQPTTAPTNPPATPIPTTAPGQNELDSLNSIIAQNDQALQGINDLVGQGENVLDSLNDLITSQGATAATVDSINDLLGQYEGVLDGINDLIGGENGVLDGVTDIGGTMSEALEGINDLLGQGEDVVSSLDSINTGVGSMTDAIEGVNDAVGALEQSITDALSIPTAAEATENANALKFDLKTLFPFCIPFDVYRIINIFNASPVTPRVQIPFNIPAIGLAYTFDLDLGDFDGVAAILRNVELVAFCVGLAIATRKFIRW